MVEKLTKNVNEGHLQEIFGKSGRIVDIDLPINNQCKSLQLNLLKNTLSPNHGLELIMQSPVMTNRGTAYITYDDVSSAESAIANWHEGQVDGAVLHVSIVLPRRRFSRSPPPARRGLPPFESRPPAAPAPYDRRPPPPSYAGAARGDRYRSPPPIRRRSPRHRGYGGGRPEPRDQDSYRPRSRSRSRSPARSRSRSYESRSRSRSPPRRARGRRESPPPPARGGGRRRRSPSYSSYSSYSRSRSRSRPRHGGRR